MWSGATNKSNSSCHYYSDDVLQFLGLSSSSIHLPQQDDAISQAIQPSDVFRAFGTTYNNLYVRMFN